MSLNSACPMHTVPTSRRLPVPVPGLIDADLWEQCASDKRYSGSLYFLPQVKEDHIHPDTGDRVQPFWRVTGFTTQTSTVERSWFVSLEEIETSGTYSLCADTYRISTRQTTGRRTKRR